MDRKDLKKFDGRPRVYVSGPYTSHITEKLLANVARAIRVAERILKLGGVPFVPHLTHFWETKFYHHRPIFWLAYDRVWLACCDLMFRLPGKSTGADIEEEMAKELGIPCFHKISDLEQELKKWKLR